LAWKAESERCEPKKKLFFLKIVLCCELQKRAKVFTGVSFGAMAGLEGSSSVVFFLFPLLRFETRWNIPSLESRRFWGPGFSVAAHRQAYHACMMIEEYVRESGK
jgi:hypothetical protein